MTTHYAVRESVANSEQMVAVFNYTADNENPVEIILRPSEIHALCKVSETKYPPRNCLVFVVCFLIKF